MGLPCCCLALGNADQQSMRKNTGPSACKQFWWVLVGAPSSLPSPPQGPSSITICAGSNTLQNISSACDLGLPCSRRDSAHADLQSLQSNTKLLAFKHFWHVLVGAPLSPLRAPQGSQSIVLFTEFQRMVKFAFKVCLGVPLWSLRFFIS